MHRIKGLSEDEILKVINSIVNQLAPNYIFGYYTLEDVKSEGVVFALEALSKFDPTKGVASEHRNTLSDRLFNFLRSHVVHRYCNMVRDNYERSELPDCKCKYCRNEEYDKCGRYQKFVARNEAKKSLFGAAREGNDIEDKEGGNLEAVSLVNEHLPTNLRSDFRRMLERKRVPSNRRAAVKDAVLNILQSGCFIDVNDDWH